MSNEAAISLKFNNNFKSIENSFKDINGGVIKNQL